MLEIRENLTNKEYQALPGISSTMVSKAIRTTPYLSRSSFYGGESSSCASELPGISPIMVQNMNIGTCVHEKLLRNNTVYHEAPFDDWRTNEAKAYRKDNADKILLVRSAYAELDLMVNNIYKLLELKKSFTIDGDILDLLNDKYKKEVAITGSMEYPGISEKVDVRAIYDAVDFDKNIIVDLKITKKPIESWLKWGYQYYCNQAIHYSMLLAKKQNISINDVKFYFLVIDSNAPYSMTLVKANINYTEEGAFLQYLNTIRILDECIKTGGWSIFNPDMSSPYSIATQDIWF